MWITDDGNDAGKECDYVAFSYFPEAGKICLHNIDFKKSRRVVLHQFGATEMIELAAGEFRILEAPKRG